MVGGPLQIFGGGRGANCAVAAARAGAEVSFIGAHGHDAFGVMAQDQLNKEGIDISNFRELCRRIAAARKRAFPQVRDRLALAHR